MASYGVFCISCERAVSDLLRSQVASAVCAPERQAAYSRPISISKTQLAPAIPSFETFTDPQSCTGTQPIFCSLCESSLVWFTDDMPVALLIFVGTVDEEVLADKVHEGTLKEAGHGKEFKRT